MISPEWVTRYTSEELAYGIDEEERKNSLGCIGSSVDKPVKDTK